MIDNKFSQTVRFIVGLMVMYFIYKLHVMGVFTRIGNLFDSGFRGDGFGGVTEVLIGLVPVMVDSVAFIGSIALTFFLFMWRALKPHVLKVLVLLDKKLEEYGVDLYEVSGPSSAPKGVDAEKLSNVLQDMDDRIELIEQGYEK